MQLFETGHIDNFNEFVERCVETGAPYECVEIVTHAKQSIEIGEPERGIKLYEKLPIPTRISLRLRSYNFTALLNVSAFEKAAIYARNSVICGYYDKARVLRTRGGVVVLPNITVP